MLSLLNYIRKTHYHLLLAGCTLLLFTTAAKAQEPQQGAKKPGYLELKGRITKEKKTVDNAEIRISNNGQLVEKLYTSGGGKFKSDLPLNKEYLVTVSYPGCYSKSLSVSTQITDKEQS